MTEDPPSSCGLWRGTQKSEDRGWRPGSSEAGRREAGKLRSWEVEKLRSEAKDRRLEAQKLRRAEKSS
jgi:hypothetical protein